MALMGQPAQPAGGAAGHGSGLQYAIVVRPVPVREVKRTAHACVSRAKPRALRSLSYSSAKLSTTDSDDCSTTALSVSSYSIVQYFKA